MIILNNTSYNKNKIGMNKWHIIVTHTVIGSGSLCNSQIMWQHMTAQPHTISDLFWHMDDTQNSDGWKHVKSGDRENKNMKIHKH